MQIITSLRLALGLVLAVAACTVALAHDFVVNGIYYERNRDGASATVTYKGASYDMYDDEYFGDVTIPSRVTYSGKSYTVRSISDYALAECTGLRLLTVLNEVPPTLKFGESTFTSIPSSCVLYVPSHSRAQYRSAYGWRYFSNL